MNVRLFFFLGGAKKFTWRNRARRRAIPLVLYNSLWSRAAPGWFQNKVESLLTVGVSCCPAHIVSKHHALRVSYDPVRTLNAPSPNPAARAIPSSCDRCSYHFCPSSPLPLKTLKASIVVDFFLLAGIMPLRHARWRPPLRWICC